MSDTRYPTRMHEVLGVEPMQEFYSEDKMLLRVNHLGRIERKMDTHPCGWDLMCNTRRVEDCINHGITRRPRLTEEQVAHLKGLLLLGFRKIQKDYKKSLIAYGGSKVTEWTLPISKQDILLGLVIDPAPLDIVQVLRQNGVEVEE